MGSMNSRWSNGERNTTGLTRNFHDHRHRIVMVGLDGAGKSTLLYKLKFGINTEIFPTLGFNAEDITSFQTSTGKVFSFIIIDVAGQGTTLCLRQLWPHHMINCDGIIYVIDCANRNRLSEAKRELFSRVLDFTELTKKPLVIAANKQDVEGAMKGSELEEYLGMNNVLRTDQSWRIVETSGQSAVGAKDLLDTMYSLIANQKKKEKRNLMTPSSSKNIQLQSKFYC